MDAHYSITAAPDHLARSVTLLLNGKFGEESLPELEQSISQARGAQQRIVIDLSEVTLVDRKTIQYFSRQAQGDVKLVNCPIYLERWLRQVNDEVEH